jgi:hypothetical protein
MTHLLAFVASGVVVVFAAFSRTSRARARGTGTPRAAS